MENKFSDTEYNALIERLFVRFPSYQTVGGKAYHPGLEAMREFDARLGFPHSKFRSIHVAGTNGKGSVCNMLASSLSAMGYRTALYTSPHLLDFRERARVIETAGGAAEGADGVAAGVDEGVASGSAAGSAAVRLIPREDVWEFCRKWWPTFDELGLSFFEITTSMAFWWFAKERVDFAVIETGLGGRLDSTNVIRPSLSVITNIGLDHCNILGDTLPEIAGEKAGIIKSGVPAVIGESAPETAPVFREKAAELGSPLFFADRDFGWTDEAGAGENGMSLGISSLDAESLLSGMDLQGCYQRKNLQTALAALSVLRKYGIAPESPVSSDSNGGQDRVATKVSPAVVDALQHTAARTGFHGRWEKISDKPLTIIDIGHNEHGLRYNFSQLERMMREEGYQLIMVYGSVSDKDYGAVVRMIPQGAKVIFTNAKGSRALPAEKAREAFTGPAEDSRVCPDVAEAVAMARKLSKDLAKPLIYIGGSTYVVSEALRAK